MLDIHRMMKLLPHRYPFLLVDKVIDQVEGKSVTAIKNVTINEPCFQGHFPENPVYPGVLILESMAQTTVCLFLDEETKQQEKDKIYYLAGIDNARFKKQVMPGDTMKIHSELVKVSQGILKMHAEVTVEDAVVCKADIMVALR